MAKHGKNNDNIQSGLYENVKFFGAWGYYSHYLK